MERSGFLRRLRECERCRYPRAWKNWCPHCSSIDPFPTRRRVLYGALALVLAGGSFAIVKLSPAIAQSEAAKTASRTKSFAAPRAESLPTKR